MLSPFAKKLLFARELRIGGKVEVIRKRKVMVDPELIEGIDLYEPFKRELEQRKSMLGLTGEGLVNFSFRLLETYGFGNFELVEMSKERAIVEVEDSPFATKLSGKCECKPIASCLKALFEFIFGECEVSEVACKAKGDKKCRFVIR